MYLILQSCGRDRGVVTYVKLVDVFSRNVCKFLAKNHIGQGLFRYLNFRGIRTIAKFRLLTKIDFNVMHLVFLCKFFWQKLQIRGSSRLLNSLLYPSLNFGATGAGNSGMTFL